MNKRETASPVYTFEYLLNPAQNWGSFKNLDIEIITPEEAPYIVDSSIELTKEGDRHYRASFTHLPQEDLIFSIYENDEIIPLDRTHWGFDYFILIVIVGILIMVAVAVVIVLKRQIKKEKG